MRDARAGTRPHKAFFRTALAALPAGARAAPVLCGLGATAMGIGAAWSLATALAAAFGHGADGWAWLAAAAAAGAGAIGFALAQERMGLTNGEVVRASVRRSAIARILALGPAGHPDLPEAVGARATLLTDRIEALDGYVARYLPARTLAVAAPALVAAAAASADPWSGAILLGAGALVPVAMALTGIGTAVASQRQFEALQALSGRFLDRMRGLPTLVLHNRQEAEAEALAAAADELRWRTLRVLRVAFLSTTALELLATGAIAALALRHAGLLTSGADPTAALFALLLAPAFFQPLRSYSGAYHEAMVAEGAAAALAPLLAAPTPTGLRLEAMPGRVVVAFSGVRVCHDPARPPALDRVTFRVNAGETVVLTGPSGAGKSTVLRLLMGFCEAETGRVAINGHDLAALLPEERRRLIAYVGQRPHLFRATLRENIRLARPEADDTAIAAAAAAARVEGFAARLPQGLDTPLGEDGWGLSGGERQRVALARAFLRDAPLVLLDEPTAHLDPGTEAEVLDSIRRLCVGRTAIIASHSAAARLGLGRVIALEAGRVVEPTRAAHGMGTG